MYSLSMKVIVVKCLQIWLRWLGYVQKAIMFNASSIVHEHVAAFLLRKLNPKLLVFGQGIPLVKRGIVYQYSKGR